MARRLNAEERGLWAKVVASVQPLHGPLPQLDQSLEAAAPKDPPPPPRKAPSVAAAPKAKTVPGNTLDAGWDRRLSRGLVAPDATVDLHGDNLATAYRRLDDRLEQAVASGARLLLLITGKPPKGEPPIARGKIRAAVGDWLASSRHAAAIAAVRNAHPRHGGTGALYIVLRRARQPRGGRP